MDGGRGRGRGRGRGKNATLRKPAACKRPAAAETLTGTKPAKKPTPDSQNDAAPASASQETHIASNSDVALAEVAQKWSGITPDFDPTEPGVTATVKCNCEKGRDVYRLHSTSIQWKGSSVVTVSEAVFKGGKNAEKFMQFAKQLHLDGYSKDQIVNAKCDFKNAICGN